MRYVSRCAANRWVFNVDLKLSVLSVRSRREYGNEFQTIGAATENDNVRRRCRGTTSWRRLADCRRWWLETSDVRTQQSTKYWGAWFWIVTPSLYWTRWWMSSQCSSEGSRSDKPQSNFRVPVMTRAAAFSLSVINRGDPASTVLQ